MAYLFTYGTIQNIEIQKNIFGRELTGVTDSLAGYKISLKKVYGKYSVITPTENRSDILEGTVYEVSKGDLKKVDEYEGEMYMRIEVYLASGKKAWVFVGV